MYPPPRGSRDCGTPCSGKSMSSSWDGHRERKARSARWMAPHSSADNRRPNSFPDYFPDSFLGRHRSRRARDRPTGLVADIAGRPQAFVGKTEAADVFTKRRDLERVFRATNAGAGNRADTDPLRGLLDRAGFQASDFGLGPPGRALGGLKESAAAARQRYEDEGADEIQTNSARHPTHVRPIYLKTFQHVEFTNFSPCRAEL